MEKIYTTAKMKYTCWKTNSIDGYFGTDHHTSFYVTILPLNSLFALCHILILYQILFNNAQYKITKFNTYK